METPIIWIVILAVLFMFVWFNNKRTMKKLKDRRNSFEERYESRRKKH